MGYLEGNCPKCGEKTREQCNAWGYGSPIRFCTRCKQEYLDQRFREVAIQGFDPKSTSPVYYVKATILCLAITLAAGGWMYYTLHFRQSWNTMTLALLIVGAIGTVGCIVLALWVGLGFAGKENAKYLAESEKRLRDPLYVQKLQSYGYVIPAQYLAGMGSANDGMQEE